MGMLLMALLWPIISLGDAAYALRWAHCIGGSSVRWLCVGPLCFWKCHQCIRMALLQWQWQLPMTCCQPIIFLGNATSKLRLADCCGSCHFRCLALACFLSWRCRRCLTAGLLQWQQLFS